MGIGLPGELNIDSIERNLETLEFCGRSPAEHWFIATGIGNDGYVLRVAEPGLGGVEYCYFNTGEHHSIADSFTEFVSGLGRQPAGWHDE